MNDRLSLYEYHVTLDNNHNEYDIPVITSLYNVKSLHYAI